MVAMSPFQMAEVAIPRGLFADILRLIAEILLILFIFVVFSGLSHMRKNQPHAHITCTAKAAKLTPNLREGCALIIEIPGLFRAGWAPSQARGPPFTLEKSIGLAQGDRWRQDRPQIDTHPGNVG